jgi:hypothetical protein
MAIGKVVAIHTGVFVEVEQDETGLLGTVILSKGDNQLSQVYRGPLGDALARAMHTSSEAGFAGYYDVAGVDGLTAIEPTRLAAVLPEIKRQSDDLQSKTGFRWGFSPQWTPGELTAMPAAQTHAARLLDLQDALVKRMAV